MKIRKYVQVFLATLLTGAVLCSGCGAANEIAIGPEDADTLAIQEDGSVLYDMTGIFDQSYYSISELAEMASTEAAEYSVSNLEGGVSLKDYGKRESDGFVNLTYFCTSSSVFADCFGYQLFYGTVADAVSGGYSLLKVDFVKLKDGTQVSGTDIMTKYPDKHIIITNFAGMIEGVYTPLYASEGCIRKISESKKTEYVDTLGAGNDAEESGKLYYILLSK